MSRPFDPDKLPDPEFQAPALVAGVVEGWRAWHVDRQLPKFGVTPRLYSVSHSSYYWAPRKMSMAQCARCGENVPGESCGCGFYSARTLKHLLSMSYPGYTIEAGQVAVIGQVANWGKTIECSSGWRAQKSYPVRLWVPYECWKLADPLEKGYGVPVKLGQWLGSPLDRKLAGDLPIRDRTDR
jgi:hypothetical protein